MADKENCAPHLTPAASKRAAAFAFDATPHRPAKKKRVELVDLPFLSNAAHLLIPNPPTPQLHKPNLRHRSREEQDSVLAPAVTSDSSEAGSSSHDPNLCVPYASDIYRYLRSKEVRLIPSFFFFAQKKESFFFKGKSILNFTAFVESQADAKNRPVANYMATVQKDVDANMRAILVDWLVEVAEEHKLLSDTIYLAVSYIDRFLSFNTIKRQNLQLLGVTSMLIAS